MTRRSFQQGFVSDPIRTRNGIAFKIRFRERTPDGKWKQRSETLYNIDGKKAAKAELKRRLDENSAPMAEAHPPILANQDSAPMPVSTFLAERLEAPIQKSAQTAITLPAVPVVPALTFREFVEQYWKPNLLRKDCKPSTISNYQSALDRHVFPILGDRLVTEIRPLDVAQLVSRLESLERSPKSIRNVLVILQGIFSVAVDNDFVQRGPVRKSHKPKYTRKEKPIWSPEQVRLILENIPLGFKCLFMCVALTGMRIGELLALQWKHIDFKVRKILIEQSLWRDQIVPPKTPDSVRIIPFGSILGGVLVIHRRDSRHNKPGDFVFCKRDGGCFTQEVLRRDVLYPVLDRLQIPRPKRCAGFHAFRHSAASLINSETGNLKLAQNLLGHSDLETTADIYTHVSNEAEREASEVLERKIFENSGNLFPICSQNEDGNSETGNRKLRRVK